LSAFAAHPFPCSSAAGFDSDYKIGNEHSVGNLYIVLLIRPYLLPCPGNVMDDAEWRRKAIELSEVQLDRPIRTSEVD
jgi:hypothetical protein